MISLTIHVDNNEETTQKMEKKDKEINKIQLKHK